MSRRRFSGYTIEFIYLLAATVLAGPALGADMPMVTVSRDGLAPETLEVHVGEVVRWRTDRGEMLQIVLDAHPDAHEVIAVRRGEVRAVFLKPSEHGYSGSIVVGKPRIFRGRVIVRPAEGQPELPPTCAAGSSHRVCIHP